jgi:hypothetical protein
MWDPQFLKTIYASTEFQVDSLHILVITGAYNGVPLPFSAEDKLHGEIKPLL